jgi:colicin import membrane protein
MSKSAVFEAQVSKLEARLKDMDEEKIQAQISTFEKACADKDAEINELKSQLDASNEAFEASTKSFKEFEEAKAASDTRVAELTEKLDAIEAESLRTNRVSALVDKGVDKAESEALVATFTGISDEQFETLVLKLTEAPFHDKEKHDEEDEKKKKKKAEAPSHYDKDEKKKKEEAMMKKKYAEKKKEDEAKADLEEAAEAAEEADDADVLEDAEVEDSAALAAHSEDESETVVASLNQYFSEVLGGTNNEKES